MAERKLTVRIIGDAKSLEQAFTRATRSSQKFNAQVGSPTIATALTRQVSAVNQITAAEEKLIRVRSRRASSLGVFRLGAVGLGAGAGLFAAAQGIRELGVRLETTGAAAFKTEGRLKNMVSALTTGNLVGAIEALRRQPQVLEDLGFAAALGADQLRALQQVADGAAASFEKYGQAVVFGAGGTQLSISAFERLQDVTEKAGTSSQRLAQEYLAQRDAIALTQFATDALADSVARLGQQFLTQSGAVVVFKGAVDDLNRAGRGEAVFGNIPSTTFGNRPGRPTIPPLSPSQRRELSLIGQEGADRLPELRDRVRQLNNQLKRGNINQEQRLRILTNIRTTEAEIAAIYKDQAADRAAATEAAARGAEAARREAEAVRERAKREAEAAKARALQAAQDRRNALISGQFRRLGLSATGDPITPGVANLKKRVAQLTANLSERGLLTPKVRAQLKRVRTVLSEALVPKDVRAKIKEMLDDIAQQLRDTATKRGPLTKFRAVDTSKLFAGLGLSPDELRAVRARTAQIGRDRKVPVTGPSAFGVGLSTGGGGVTITGPVTVVASNPDAFEREITKRARRRVTQTTGHHAGNGMGWVR
jgi:hypothetical protein